MAIFILLIIQAICELSLPQYTSNIVNIGINSSGIESVIPDCIRETQLETIEAFLFGNDLKTVQDNYKKIDYKNLSESKQKSYKKKYPLVLSESLYEWNGDKKKRGQVESAFSKAVITISAIQREGKDVTALAKAPEESRIAALKGVEKQIGSLDETMLSMQCRLLCPS